MEKPKKASKIHLVVGLLALWGLVLLVTGAALAGSKTLSSSAPDNCFWSDPSIWNPYGVPDSYSRVSLESDTPNTHKTVAYLYPPSQTDYVIYNLELATWGYSNTSVTLWYVNGPPLHVIENLTINASGPGTCTFLQENGLVKVGEYIENTDEFHGGSLVLSTYGDPSAQGIYRLTGGTLKAREEIVGNYGRGAILQEGGINDTRTAVEKFGGWWKYEGKIILGREADGNMQGNGLYALSGGAVETLELVVGGKGTGTFRQTGGNIKAANLYVGGGGGGKGTFELQGTGGLKCAKEYIGFTGTGVFTQTGGVNSVSWPIGEGYNSLNDQEAFLELGTNPFSQGTYNLSGGKLIAPKEIIGRFGLGTVNHTSGTNRVENLSLGKGPSILSALLGIKGSYKLSGTESLLEVSSDAIIGDTSDGIFEQTGGVHRVSQDLYLALGPGTPSYPTHGTYNLSAGDLIVQGNECIGWGGIGKFIQSGGTNMIRGHLYLGYYPGVGKPGGPNTKGTYELNGGILVAAAEFLSPLNDTFTQTGGYNVVLDTLEIGNLSTYNLEGGTLLAYKMDVKYGGTFNKTGSIFATGDLTNSGTVNLAGTGPTLVAGKTENQEGGQINIADNPVQFLGDVVNYGGLQVAGTTVTFGGDLQVLGDGFLVGDQDSEWHLANDLINQNSLEVPWHTRAATLKFIEGEDNRHLFSMGETPGTQTWGSLDVTDQILYLGQPPLDDLKQGDDFSDLCYLAVGEILGVAFNQEGLVTNIFGNGFDIRYDATLPGNEYLSGWTYYLQNGGRLVATPVPAAWLLVASGLVGLLGIGARRKKN